MLHPTLLAELLDDEVSIAAERLGQRAEDLQHDGRFVRYRVTGGTGLRLWLRLWLRLDAANYDGEPCRLDVCDNTGGTAEAAAWPPGMAYGTHPVHRRPWVCARFLSRCGVLKSGLGP